MSRRQRGVERDIAPDPRYGSRLVTRFISRIMQDGKRSVAERIFYEALDLVGDRTEQEPLEVFEQAVTNCKPVLEVKSRRVGGATYQVPIEVRPERRDSVAMRWLTEYSRQRNERSMSERLAAELMAAARGEGNAVRRKDEVHRMAEANKAFAHYRW